MIESDERLIGARKNTFLSRVFGIHSSGVENSLNTAELSHFSIPNDPGFSTDIRDSHRNLAIESDQETSSNDESNESREDEPLIAQSDAIRFDGVAQRAGTINSETDYDNDDENADETEDFSDQDLGSSISKHGQPSSDEDEQNEDIPLFNKNINAHSSGPGLISKVNKNIKGRNQGSRVFGRILPQKNDAMYGLNNKTEPEESFLFRRDSVSNTNDEYRSSAFKLKPPPIFSNVSSLTNISKNKLETLSPKERALWKWANVENLDFFLQQVYDYYLGNGLYCIIVEKVLHLATVLFVVFISTYMGHCIDYSRLEKSRHFADIHIDYCYKTQLSITTKAFLWCFYAFVGLRLLQIYFDIKNLKEIKNFYNYLLNISDKDLQTIPWQLVVGQLILLKDQNAVTANAAEVKAKNRLSAHDVANRIMRRENYVIALYDNDILEISLPIPFFRNVTLTKTLEWNINLCILGFAFNDKGYLKQMFLRENQREFLSEELKKRFILAGFLNIILAPFLVTYFVLLNFFRYFNEYKTSPGSIGSRQYTPTAEWKFREYNELYHLFQKRMKLSMSIANDYVNQFPNSFLGSILSFVQFVSGSFVAILAIMTIFDPENFLNFEITKDRTALFYMSIFGTIWAVCHSAIDDEYRVFEPEETLKTLTAYTHYSAKSWEGRLHTEDVKNEFCTFFDLRIISLFRELISLVVTPFLLWFALPRKSEKIIDFIRDCTVYEEGLGYVCRYAMFDLPNIEGGAKDTKIKTSRMFVDNEEQTDSDSDSGVNKMMQSYIHFVDDYKNSENALGKYQIPKQKKSADQSNDKLFMNRKYSWKQQFELGKQKKARSIGNANEFRAGKIIGKRDGLDMTSLDGSFINKSGLVREYPTDFQEEHNRGNGVIGLLNQYYRKSEIGR